MPFFCNNILERWLDRWHAIFLRACLCGSREGPQCFANICSTLMCMQEPDIFALIFLTDDLTNGMQSSYGLACAGSDMAHNVSLHLSTHYVPAIFLQVCLKLIVCILFLKIRLSVAKSDSLSQYYTSWPILSLALHIWFHNCVWRMLCIRASLSQEDTSAESSQASLEAGSNNKPQNDKPAESWEASPLCVERLCLPASKWAFTVVIQILGYSCCLKNMCTLCLKIRQSVLSGIMWS